MFAYRTVAVLLVAASLTLPGASAADDADLRIKNLENEVKRQAETIDTMKDALSKLKAPDPADPKTGGFFGGSPLTNPNISLVLDFSGYASNLNRNELASRGIPGFSTQGLTQRNGFNLDAAELGIFAPVDPYFNLYTTLPIDESGITLEEAFFVTTALPAGFQVKAGKFKSNFSRLDAQHPHAWDFKDIALPYRAFLGNEGLGGEKGMQITYLPPLSIFTVFGAEILQGENNLIFGSDAADAPHAFSLFVKTSFEPDDNSTLYFGPSVLFGSAKNGSIVAGADFKGDSTLYDLEFVWKWKPASREGFVLQSEYLYLIQDGNLTDSTTAAAIGSLKRRQDGFYLQGIYQLDRWRYGLRYDALQLFSDTFQEAGTQHYFGPAPWRASANVDFDPTEFSRIRFQYTHDMFGRDGRENNEFFTQFIFTVGAHAAHTF